MDAKELEMLRGTMVSAKRAGALEVLTPEQEFDFDEYEHDSDELLGELEIIHSEESEEMNVTTVYLVGGQEADPTTIVSKLRDFVHGRH